MYNAQEKQKYYFFKIRENILMKNVCKLTGKSESSYQIFNQKINEYKERLTIYEKIIAMCYNEFEECKNKIETDFKELFNINQEKALAVITKKNIIIKFVSKIKNNFNGYNNFYKIILQKYDFNISKLKNETLDICIRKVNQETLNFSNKVANLVGNEHNEQNELFDIEIKEQEIISNQLVSLYDENIENLNKMSESLKEIEKNMKENIIFKFRCFIVV